MKEKLSYCGELVRQHDPDRFLISLFAPADRREALWALFAFNYEIAKTREVVSETTLGHIRLQWWRDAIKGVYEEDKVLEHEVVKPLAAAIEAYSLPRDEFDNLCYAREFDLEGVAPHDMAGLMNYLDYTGSPLLRLAVRISGGDPAQEPIQSAAINYGLIGILRSLPVHAQQGRCYLPLNMLQEVDLKEGELLSSEKNELLQMVTEKVCGHYVAGIKSESKIVKAYSCMSGMYSNQLKKLKYNPLSPRMSLPPAFKELRLILHTILL